MKQLSFILKTGLFSAALLLFKLVLMPFVHVTNADAVSRIYLALEFAENPHWITSGNWPPIYFYIMGYALQLYDNQFFTPIFVNIAFSVALVFPMFFALRRMFEEKIAFLLVVFFSFSPIIFRMSLTGMAELSYLFFVILSISTLVKGIFENKFLFVFLSGLILGIGGGIRYESWFLGLLIICYIGYYRSIKEALMFALPFSVVPIVWLTTNYLSTNDALDSFDWAINLSDNREIKSVETLLRRIWWYPLSILFSFGPIAFFFFIKELKNYKSNKISYLLLFTFSIFLSVWIFNSLRGSLLLQQRFGITLFLLLFPFLGYYFKNNQKNLYLKTAVFSLSAFMLAFVYNSKGARPIPRLLTDDASIVSEIINENTNENTGLICDFWNWETTYNIPFSTGLPRKNIVIIDKNKSVKKQIGKVLMQFSQGVILVNKSSRLFRLVKNKESSLSDLSLENIFENKTIVCYKYNTIY